MTDALLDLRRELAALTPRKRLDRILERKDALKVVRALPVQDVYATLREVGVEDCLELLELCSPRQVQAFLDLDGWRGDRVDSGSMAQWLRAIFAANPDRAVGQLRGLDIELLTLLVKLHTRIYDMSQEEEPEGDVGLHTITPDQRYLIVYGGIGDDERMQIVLKEAFDRLMSRDLLFVLRLCEAVRWELPSSLEDDAYRWRNARMADLGFMPKHEAAEVFAWRDPDAPLEQVPAPRAPVTEAADPDAQSVDLSTSVLFPWAMMKDGATAFAQATRTLPDSVRDGVAHQVMLTANRVHCADGGDTGDPEALHATAKQVIDTVGVALSYRCQGDPAKLPTLLMTTSVSTLFRVGHSLSLKLQQELRARIGARDSGLMGDGVLRLDAPLREVAAGLLRARPLLFCGLLDPKRVDYRPAASLVELAALSRAIAEIGFRAALLGPRGFGATDEVLARHGNPDPADQPCHGAVVGALLARRLLGQEIVTAPITRDDLEPLRKRIVDDKAVRDAIDAFAVSARGFAPLPGAQDANDLEVRARGYATAAVAALKTELVALESDPDARFIATVWCTR